MKLILALSTLLIAFSCGVQVEKSLRVESSGTYNSGNFSFNGTTFGNSQGENIYYQWEFYFVGASGVEHGPCYIDYTLGSTALASFTSASDYNCSLYPVSGTASKPIIGTTTTGPHSGEACVKIKDDHGIISETSCFETPQVSIAPLCSKPLPNIIVSMGTDLDPGDRTYNLRPSEIQFFISPNPGDIEDGSIHFIEANLAGFEPPFVWTTNNNKELTQEQFYNGNFSSGDTFLADMYSQSCNAGYLEAYDKTNNCRTRYYGEGTSSWFLGPTGNEIKHSFSAGTFNPFAPLSLSLEVHSSDFDLDGNDVNIYLGGSDTSQGTKVVMKVYSVTIGVVTKEYTLNGIENCGLYIKDTPADDGSFFAPVNSGDSVSLTVTITTEDGQTLTETGSGTVPAYP